MSRLHILSDGIQYEGCKVTKTAFLPPNIQPEPNHVFTSNFRFTRTAVRVLSSPVVSDSLGPHELEPSRLFCPWYFSREEYWRGLPFPPPGDLPDPGIKLTSPALAHEFFTTLPGKPKNEILSKYLLTSLSMTVVL